MVGWCHRLNGHELEQTEGDSEGQGSLVCHSSWGPRVGHNLATEQNKVNSYLMGEPRILNTEMIVSSINGVGKTG